jgi:hypothetical protein
VTKATSAYDYFIPDVVNYYARLGFCHLPSGPVSSCLQCQLCAESIYQHAMARWESFLVEVIIDHIQGRPTAHPLPSNMVRAAQYPSRQAAQDAFHSTRMRNGTVTRTGQPQPYILLHRPSTVIEFAKHWVPNTDMENVFTANAVRIQRILEIRHGLSHGTDHAQRAMRVAFLHFSPLKTYATPGISPR